MRNLEFPPCGSFVPNGLRAGAGLSLSKGTPEARSNHLATRQGGIDMGQYKEMARGSDCSQSSVSVFLIGLKRTSEIFVHFYKVYPSMALRGYLLLLAAIALAGQVGCGQVAAVDLVAFEDLNPVTGQVQFKGEPIPEGSVRLYPVDALGTGTPTHVASGVVDEQGNFEIYTYRPEGRGQGAPAGEYRLTFSWSGRISEMTQEKQDELKELLPQKYTRPQTSDVNVTVVSGPNTIELITLK